uniref:DUF4065 domain-containing protein n=1 Tax=Heterorhabditis bacteriophora TaxID=37862 RepID=A0A1I7XCI0_HETBA
MCKSFFLLDDDFFVMMASTIPKAERNLHGKWKDVEVDGGTTYRIQTQCDVGLEYVVEDQENDEHVTNRNLLSLLLVQKSEQAVQDLMLEWLQRASPNVLDEMRVYSPEKALTMDQWEKVPYRKVESANYNSIHRPVYESLVTIIDAVSQDDAYSRGKWEDYQDIMQMHSEFY